MEDNTINEENNDHLILNSVTNVPWISTQQLLPNPVKRSAPYYNPAHAEYGDKTIQNYKSIRRNHNVEFLVAAFSGLKKYQARAALILADDELEKASFLVGMTVSFNRILIGNRENRLRNDRVFFRNDFFSNINLQRLNEVIFGNSNLSALGKSAGNIDASLDPVKNLTSNDETTSNNVTDPNTIITDDDCGGDESTSKGKVGIAITKVDGDYKADVLS